MKCAYNATILDSFLDHNITFAYCIGASGGFGNLASYLAGQRGRNLRFLTEHIHNPGYLGLRSFLKTGNLFGLVSNALRLRFFKRRHGSALSDNTAETTASVTTESPVQKISVKQTTIKQSNGGTTMKKELMIEGMMCQNCAKHVTHALDGIPGASHIQVSLEDKKATVEVPESVTDETLKAAVTEAGYEVTEIIPHEG